MQSKCWVICPQRFLADHIVFHVYRGRYCVGTIVVTSFSDSISGCIPSLYHTIPPVGWYSWSYPAPILCRFCSVSRYILTKLQHPEHKWHGVTYIVVSDECWMDVFSVQSRQAMATVLVSHLRWTCLHRFAIRATTDRLASLKIHSRYLAEVKFIFLFIRFDSLVIRV